MKKYLLVILLLPVFVTGCTSSLYKAGDCITPTNESYTWYGKYARVEALAEIDGSSGKKYVLAFPKAGINDAIYELDIESNTKKIDSSFCSN